MKIRIIPRLDVKGPNLVKGVRFEGLRVLGRPERFAAHYYAEGADEILYQDAVASLYGRNGLADIIRRTAGDVFIPLTVGGGIRTADDVRAALRAGADKVCINTAAIRRPGLIREIVDDFGSSTIAVGIEAALVAGGRAETFTDYGRERTGRDAVEWAAEAAGLGAGEIVLTSVDRDGTGLGLDIDLLRRVRAVVACPVVVSGGAGSAADVAAAAEAGADGVALASVLHYDAVRRLGPDPEAGAGEGNLEFLLDAAGRVPARVVPSSVAFIKAELVKRGIPCRAA